MSSMKISSDRKKYCSEPFFRFTLKNNWQHCALYFVLMILSIILPVAVMTGNLKMEEITGTALKNSFLNLIESSGLLSVLVSAVIGVLAGMSTLTFVNSKQMTGCYNSFPIKRERIFFIETSVKAIYYIVGYLTTNAVAAIIMRITFDSSVFTEAHKLKLIQLFVCGIMVFIYTYSTFLLAGGLTGTSAVRFIVALIIMFLPAALYALIIACADIGISTLYSPYYLSSSVFRVILSPYRLCEAITSVVNSTSSTNYYSRFANVFFAIPESAVYYLTALVLHKYRKSESSGNTIIWKPVFSIVKYVTMFTSGLLGIVIFSLVLAVNGRVMWSIFGMIFGLVISFMILNGILYRSAKSLFRDIRGLVSVGAVLAMFVVVVIADVFGINERILPLSNTSSLNIKIQTDAITVELDDKASLQRIIPALSEFMSDYDDTVYYRESPNSLWSNDAENINKYFSDIVEIPADEDYPDRYKYQTYASREYMSDNRFFIVFVQKAKFGIPVARRIGLYTNCDFWNEVCGTTEYLEAVNRFSEINVDNLVYIHVNFLNVNNDIDFGVISSAVEKTTVERTAVDMDVSYHSLADEEYITKAKPITKEIIDSCKYERSDRENGFIVGYINAYQNENYPEIDCPSRFPIYSTNIELINRAMELSTLSYDYGVYGANNFIPYDGEFSDTKEFTDYLAQNYIDAMAIVDFNTMEIKLLDEGTYSKVISGSTAVMGYDGNMKYYTKPDEVSNDYLVIAARKIDIDSDLDFYNDYITFRDGGITKTELAALFENAG